MKNRNLALAVIVTGALLAGCAGGGGGGHHGGGGGGGGGGAAMVEVGLASVVPNNFLSQKTGAIAVTVQNTGGLATSSATTVTATLPPGLNYVSAAGSGWNCGASGGTSINCSTSAVIAANSNASVLRLSIAIAANTSSSGVITFTVANPQGTNAVSQLPMNFTILYTVGGSVQGLTAAQGLVLTDNGGDRLAVGANGPFTFTTALQNGTAYAAAVASQPGAQSCQLASASGMISAANVTSISVNCVTPSGHYAFVGNKFSSNVSVYLIAADGTLAQITGSPFPAKGVSGLGISPGGTLLYATDYGPDTVTGFSVASGVLTPVAQGPVAVGKNPVSAAIDPSGKFLYVGNLNSNNVSAFTLNSATGALTPTSGSPFALPGGGVSIAIDPLGKFLYVTGTDVSGFSFDPSTGVLTPIAGSPFATGTNPTGIAIDPAGKFCYVANNINGNVSAFTIGATGALTPITGSPYATGTGTGPYGVAIDPSGKYLYITLNSAGTVFAFGIDAIGALTSLGPAVLAGTSPAQIAVDPTGKFVYVANEGSNNVSGYSIAVDGELVPLPGSPFAAGNGAQSIVVF